MSTILDRIIEEVQQLPPDEQRQLREKLNSIVPSSPTEDELEDALEREMIADGFLSAPQPSTTSAEDFYNFKPIKVEGTPLSEMIIEERR